MKDYQLHPGDLLQLRLQSALDHQYHVVPFHLVGVVREFPTAPKDSFLVANAPYIAQQTGTAPAEIVLPRASGDPATLAAAARRVVSGFAGVKVTDLGATQGIISSSLTAVDLHGLTRIELGFAVLMVAGATGLIMALNMAERRRTLAILAALGARDGQIGSFLWSEGLLILGGGAVIGAATGFAVAEMLVKVLTGVFDPPPEALAVPGLYLAGLAIAVLANQWAKRRPTAEALRHL